MKTTYTLHYRNYNKNINLKKPVSYSRRKRNNSNGIFNIKKENRFKDKIKSIILKDNHKLENLELSEPFISNTQNTQDDSLFKTVVNYNNTTTKESSLDVNLPKVKLNLDSIKKNNLNLSNNELKKDSNEEKNENKKLFLNTTSKFEQNHESKIPHSIFNRFEKKIKNNFYKNIRMTKRTFGSILYKFQPKNFKELKNQYKTKLKIIDKYIDEHPYIIMENKSKEEVINDLSKNLILDSSRESFYSKTNETSTTFSKPSLILNSFWSKDRLRTFKKYTDIDYILNKKWKEEELGYVSDIKYNIYLINDLNFQSNYIKDEMSILLDDIQYYKTSYFGKNDILYAFTNKDTNYQKKINRDIEELCAILNVIPGIILKEYYAYHERYIAAERATEDDLKDSFVKDEGKCFIENIKLLSKISIFLKCSFEVYLILIKEIKDDILLKKNDFFILQNILEKSRFIINELIISGKNIINDLNFDRKLIKKYKPMLNKDGFNSYEIRHYDTKQNNLFNKMSSQLFFKKNDITQKLMRISNSLNSNKERKNEEEAFKQKQKKLTTNGNYFAPMAVIVKFFYNLI
jgi:hypothetical protein